MGCLSSAQAKVNITITPVNDTPVLAHIGNKTIVKNTLLTFTATATDVDAGQTLRFSLINPPSGAAISASGVFTWTPSTAGSFPFKIRVTDNGSPILFDEEQITVTVTNTALIISAAADNQSGVEKQEMKIYPNPSKGILYVHVNNKAMIALTDQNGRVLLTKNIDRNGTINLVNIPSGLYYLKNNTTAEVQAVMVNK
jgi:hypothetical protein